MDTIPTIPDSLKDKYELRQHLVGDLFLVEVKISDSANEYDVSYDMNRHNILALETGEILINYDHQGQISLSRNPNYILVGGNRCEGLFSVKERRLIIPVLYERVDVLIDTDEFFIIEPRHHYVHGVLNAKGETILGFEWETIVYKGNCLFDVRKHAGGDLVEATFNAKDRKLIYKPSCRQTDF